VCHAYSVSGTFNSDFTLDGLANFSSITKLESPTIHFKEEIVEVSLAILDQFAKLNIHKSMC